MRRLRSAAVWSALGLVAALVVGAGAFLRWERDPVRRARLWSGLELPSDTVVLFAEESWSSFLGDGDAAFVFRIPEELGLGIVADCEAHCLRAGPTEKEGRTITVFAKHIGREARMCHRVRDRGPESDVVIVTPTRLGVYFASL